ncbi:MAG: hypothetical protein M5U01_02200 [Ardenticatenaceae bacterium]|nr:hypothetical protein [Ardenticatenaceae bacterium]
MAKQKKEQGYSTDLTNQQWALPELLFPEQTEPDRPGAAPLTARATPLITWTAW